MPSDMNRAVFGAPSSACDWRYNVWNPCSRMFILDFNLAKALFIRSGLTFDPIFLFGFLLKIYVVFSRGLSLQWNKELDFLNFTERGIVRPTSSMSAIA